MSLIFAEASLSFWRRSLCCLSSTEIADCLKADHLCRASVRVESKVGVLDVDAVNCCVCVLDVRALIASSDVPGLSPGEALFIDSGNSLKVLSVLDVVD